MGCDVMEWVKENILKWFGHVRGMESDIEFVKKVNLSSVEGSSRRGRPLGRWEEKR